MVGERSSSHAAVAGLSFSRYRCIAFSSTMLKTKKTPAPIRMFRVVSAIRRRQMTKTATGQTTDKTANAATAARIGVETIAVLLSDIHACLVLLRRGHRWFKAQPVFSWSRRGAEGSAIRRPGAIQLRLLLLRHKLLKLAIDAILRVTRGLDLA